LVSDLLIKLKILDDDQTVSLTSCALWLVLIKLAIVSTASLTEVGGLLIAMSAYQGKKLIKGKQNQDNDAAIEKLSIDSTILTSQLHDLQGKVTALTLSGAIKK